MPSRNPDLMSFDEYRIIYPHVTRKYTEYMVSIICMNSNDLQTEQVEDLSPPTRYNTTRRQTARWQASPGMDVKQKKRRECPSAFVYFRAPDDGPFEGLLRHPSDKRTDREREREASSRITRRHSRKKETHKKLRLLLDITGK